MELPIIEPSFLTLPLPIITTEDGAMVDLAYRDMIVDADTTTIMATSILVTPEFAGRPDLLAMAIFGDPSKFDVICEYNSISDPFSIAAGDVLYVPTTDTLTMNSGVIASTLRSTPNLSTDSQTPISNNPSMQELNSKIATIDPARARLRNSSPTPTPPVRTPNMTTTPPTTVVQDGIIKLGTNPSTQVCKDSMTPTQSMATAIRTAVLQSLQSK